MNWNNWPYWLRGAAIGALVGVLFVFYLDHCEAAKSLQYPDDMYATLRCPWLFILGPGLLLQFIIFDIPSVRNLEIADKLLDSFTFEKIMTVVGWIFLCAIISFLANYKKSKNKRPQ